jgi:hypothetical protein
MNQSSFFDQTDQSNNSPATADTAAAVASRGGPPGAVDIGKKNDQDPHIAIRTPSLANESIRHPPATADTTAAVASGGGPPGAMTEILIEKK